MPLIIEVRLCVAIKVSLSIVNQFDIMLYHRSVITVLRSTNLLYSRVYTYDVVILWFPYWENHSTLIYERINLLLNMNSMMMQLLYVFLLIYKVSKSWYKRSHNDFAKIRRIMFHLRFYFQIHTQIWKFFKYKWNFRLDINKMFILSIYYLYRLLLLYYYLYIFMWK